MEVTKITDNYIDSISNEPVNNALNRIKDIYGIDTSLLNDDIKIILTDFVNHGASTSIMKMINRLQQDQDNDNLTDQNEG